MEGLFFGENLCVLLLIHFLLDFVVLKELLEQVIVPVAEVNIGNDELSEEKE